MKMEYDVRLFCLPRSPRLTMLVSVGFFDDMYIPLTYLPQPSTLYASYLFSFRICLLHHPPDQ